MTTSPQWTLGSLKPLQWIIPLILAIAVASGSVYTTIVTVAKADGTESAAIATLQIELDEHAVDREIHMSIESAVKLENRLGSIEGSMNSLNETLKRYEDKF